MQKIIKHRSGETLLELAHLPEIIQRIYSSRGIKSVKEIDYTLTHLLSWQDLTGIQAAITCLTDALKAQRHVVIIADFDVDGATSCALAVSALREFGMQKVSYLVPNRFTMGYGLTPEIVTLAQQLKAEILLTVDNGIASHAGVAAAHAAGMQVIITDHHLPAATLPAAEAIVNPNQPNDTFPSKHLCGVGVVFYVMLALRAQLIVENYFQDKAIPNMAQFLDLVALGTVADVVILDHNNRILVHQGLQRIRQGKTRPGIKALLAVAGKELQQLKAQDLGFALAPRLNAAGRLEDMSVGIECLLTKDSQRAQEIAQELNILNQQRKSIEQNMHNEALNLLNKTAYTANDAPVGVCLYADNWHQGVIGILASRIKEKVYRPVICFAKDNIEGDHIILKGSARSISGVHIRDILDSISKQYPDLIIKFGGHAMAAGLSIKHADFNSFQQAFIECLTRFVDADILTNIQYTDGELNELTLTLADALQAAGPWGQGFSEPLFYGKFQVLFRNIVGGRHLRFTLQHHEQTLEAIAFFVSENLLNSTHSEIEVLYRLDINEFRNIRKVQLIIEDFIE